MFHLNGNMRVFWPEIQKLKWQNNTLAIKSIIWGNTIFLCDHLFPLKAICLLNDYRLWATTTTFLGYDGIQYNFSLFLKTHKRQLITRFLQLNNSTLKNVMLHSPNMNISSSAKWYSSAPLNLSTTATLGVDRRKGLLWHRQVAIMGREGCFLFYFIFSRSTTCLLCQVQVQVHA